MKANELMIGDFFLYKENIVEIVSIDGGTETVWIDGEKVSALRKVGDLQPIPLATEILEKNDFTRYGQVYANLQQWVGKFEDKRKSFVQDILTGEWRMNDVWIKYVHEFQHILKLCGIEKTIEL